MSSALAIASVSMVIKDLLNNGIIDHDITGVVGGNVTVTALPPDRVDTSLAGEQSQLNLFMYMVTQNTGWRNQNLPSSNSQGDRISNPFLALDLHYLLSAYSPNELHPEILLGYAMQLLFENPVLPRDAIRKSLQPPQTVSGGGLPANLRSLSTSGLADQVEMIKIIPVTLTTEEISKLWTAFQTKYRPTTAYIATVVLIESKKSIQSAPPVKTRKIVVSPLNQPAVDSILSQANPGSPVSANQKILTGFILVVEGTQLKADAVDVNIDGVMVTPVQSDITDTKLSFSLPANLPAGVHSLQVVHPVLLGSPPLPHPGAGAASNAEAFILCPQIVNTLIQNPLGSGASLRSASIQLTVNPAIGPGQDVLFILNEFIPGPATTIPKSYSFSPPLPSLDSPPAGPSATIIIPITGVKAADYIMRIRVDGAESPVSSDAGGQYNGPLITIA
jgi:hypothetical protein